MKSQSLPFPGFLRTPWHDALVKAGFAPGQGAYRLNGVTLKNEDRWFQFAASGSTASGAAALGQLGQPGLWKWINVGARPGLAFEFPEAALNAEADGDGTDADEAPASLAAIIAWCLASKAGKLPDGWRSPAREQVAGWLPAGALTVQCGSVVRQGQLILTAERWALRFPILSELPADLPVARRAWLELVLADAQSRWRMVRVGITDGAEHPAVVAEADFSGAPHSENLFSAGLDGVRHVVAWAAETVELLADAKVASELLASPPCPNLNPERKNP